MKKIILCVMVTLVCYMFFYGLWSFVYMDFNPRTWEMGSRICYCFLASASAAFANMGVIFYEPKKNNK